MSEWSKAKSHPERNIVALEIERVYRQGLTAFVGRIAAVIAFTVSVGILVLGKTEKMIGEDEAKPDKSLHRDPERLIGGRAEAGGTLRAATQADIRPSESRSHVGLKEVAWIAGDEITYHSDHRHVQVGRAGHPSGNGLRGPNCSPMSEGFDLTAKVGSKEFWEDAAFDPSTGARAETGLWNLVPAEADVAAGGIASGGERTHIEFVGQGMAALLSLGHRKGVEADDQGERNLDEYDEERWRGNNREIRRVAGLTHSVLTDR